MSKVIFVPGLQGQTALAYAFTSAIGPNETILRKVAKDTASVFERLNYQSQGSKNPTLFEMECSIARQLGKVIHDAKGEPIIAVGSSAGFGVLVGALSRLNSSTSPIALVGIKPVPDPLMAIELQINNSEVLAAIKSGQLAAAPMPVASVDGVHDTFTLSAKHLNDHRALRILSDDTHAHRFNNACGHALAASSVLYGNKDPLTPAHHMQRFADAVAGAQTKLVELDGDHASDFTDFVYLQTQTMIATLG